MLEDCVLIKPDKHFETILDRMRYGSLWRTHRIICVAWRSSDGCSRGSSTEQESFQLRLSETVHPAGDTERGKQEGSKAL